MTTPKSQKQPVNDALPRPDQPPIDIAVQRKLRRDLGLTNDDIKALDIELAVEAGLLSKPHR